MPPAKMNRAVRASKRKRAGKAKTAEAMRISLGMRRSILSSSPFIFLIFKKFIKTLDEVVKTRDNAEERKNKKQPGIGSEEFIKKIAQEQSHGNGRRQHKTKGTQECNFGVVDFPRVHVD